MASQSSETDNASGRSLLDSLFVIGNHYRVLFGFPLVAAVVGAGASFFIAPTYVASTRLLPPQQSQSSVALLYGQISALAGGLGQTLGVKNPNDLYVGLLRSRTITDRLVEQFDLTKIYDADLASEARESLVRSTRVSTGKDGIIVVDVEDSDPNRAAALANAYVAGLIHLTESLALTEASQRRLFFEKQLSRTKEDLATAELAFRQTQERTGLIKLEEQGRAVIEAVASLRAQVAAKEVQLGAMRSYATESNPDVLRVWNELEGLRQQLKKLEKVQGSDSSSVIVPTGSVPKLGLEFVRSYRDLKYQEGLFEALAKQYELARLDEAKDAPIVQVIDKAIPPDKKASPKRALIAVICAIAGGFAALIWIFLIEALRHSEVSPEHSDRLKRLQALI